jgi:hypothetical protein
VLAIQGALSATALYLIGVPYALALGAWVSITAVIPYLGAWLGAVPAAIVAFSISPTAVVLTALVFLVIQQLLLSCEAAHGASARLTSLSTGHPAPDRRHHLVPPIALGHALLGQVPRSITRTFTSRSASPLDINSVRTFDDVEVGDHVPRFIPDKAPARALSNDRSSKGTKAYLLRGDVGD